MISSETGAVFHIKVGDEAGKLIGKQGRTARAIRTVLAATGSKMQRVYFLNITSTESKTTDELELT